MKRVSSRVIWPNTTENQTNRTKETNNSECVCVWKLTLNLGASRFPVSCWPILGATVRALFSLPMVRHRGFLCVCSHPAHIHLFIAFDYVWLSTLTDVAAAAVAIVEPNVSFNTNDSHFHVVLLRFSASYSIASPKATIEANKTRKLSSHSKFIFVVHNQFCRTFSFCMASHFDTYQRWQCIGTHSFTRTHTHARAEQKAHAGLKQVTKCERNELSDSWQTNEFKWQPERDRTKPTLMVSNEIKCTALLCIVGRNTSLLYRIVIEFSKHKIRWSQRTIVIGFCAVNLICHFWPFTN